MQSYILRKGKIATLVACLIALGLFVMVAACAVGSAGFPLGATYNAILERILGRDVTDSVVSTILFKVRLPRVFMAYLVGSALAVSGASMQGLFKNAMADPHILGVSSGAALGATIAMVFNLQTTALGMSGIAIMAFLGGLLSVFTVAMLARIKGRVSTISLLLSGVAVSSTLSALISSLMIFNRDKMEHVLLWTLGSFASASWNKLQILTPVALFCAFTLMIYARDMNAMLVGEEEARSLGVNVKRTRVVVLLLTSLMTATSVSFSGIIGFVGLMVPHAVRLIVGPDNRALLPVTFLGGGVYMLVMDTLARTVAHPTELPVGVLTAIVGGPFFLYLLRKQKS